MGAALAALAPYLARATTISRITAFTFKGLDDSDILFASYAGHPILWSTPRRCAAAPRNMPACRSSGSAAAYGG